MGCDGSRLDHLWDRLLECFHLSTQPISSSSTAHVCRGPHHVVIPSRPECAVPYKARLDSENHKHGEDFIRFALRFDDLDPKMRIGRSIKITIEVLLFNSER